jgi:hypothetical protein
MNNTGKNRFTGIPFEARFWSKVEINPGGCWLWKGSTDSSGYGTFRNEDGLVTAPHIIVYARYVGEIVSGNQIHHECNNPTCVNFHHLKQVTALEHSLLTPDSVASKARARTHCNNGHELTYENTYHNESNAGRRRCRICQQAAAERSKKKRTVTET